MRTALFWLMMISLGCAGGSGDPPLVDDAPDATAAKDDIPGSPLFPDGFSWDGVVVPDAPITSDTTSSSLPALTLRIDPLTRHEVYRGSIDVIFMLVTLQAMRTLDFIPPTFSFDAVDRAGCVLGRDGRGSAQSFVMRDQETRVNVAGPVELTGIATAPHAGADLREGRVVHLTAGEERQYAIMANIRLTDPGCPLVGQSLRLTVTDGDGHFFRREGVFLVDESRFATEAELVGNTFVSGEPITVIGPPYTTPVVSTERGDVWFCGEIPGDTMNRFGQQGCCTNGQWPELGDEDGAIHAGMLLRGSERQISYVFSDPSMPTGLQRATFPTTVELNSWQHPSGMNGLGLDVLDPTVCGRVIQIRDAQLMALPLAGEVSLNPGSTFVRREAGGDTYVVGPNRVLYRVLYRGDAAIPETWLVPPYLRILPASAFDAYTLNISDPAWIAGDEQPSLTLRRYRTPGELIETTIH